MMMRTTDDDFICCCGCGIPAVAFLLVKDGHLQGCIRDKGQSMEQKNGNDDGIYTQASFSSFWCHTRVAVFSLFP